MGQDINPMPALLAEYETLRGELMTIQSRQQVNVVQGIVVIGGLFIYVAKQWAQTDQRILALLCLALAIPMCCYTIILTAAALFARGRQIQKHLAKLELRVSRYCRGELSYNAMDWTNRYLSEENAKRLRRTALHFDLIAMLVFMGFVAAISLWLAYEYNDGGIGVFLWINAAVIVLYSTLIRQTLAYVHDAKSDVACAYSKFKKIKRSKSTPLHK